MQRKITRFALAGKCGSFEASGLLLLPLLSSRALANVANDEKARNPNPDEIVFNNARLDGNCEGLISGFIIDSPYFDVRSPEWKLKSS
jgi:hypothetical protein